MPPGVGGGPASSRPMAVLAGGSGGSGSPRWAAGSRGAKLQHCGLAPGTGGVFV